VKPVAGCLETRKLGSKAHLSQLCSPNPSELGAFAFGYMSYLRPLNTRPFLKKGGGGGGGASQCSKVPLALKSALSSWKTKKTPCFDTSSTHQNWLLKYRDFRKRRNIGYYGPRTPKSHRHRLSDCCHGEGTRLVAHSR